MSGGAHTIEDFHEEMNDLVLGLKKEKECRDFYDQAVEQVSDPRAKALYRWFAKAENERIGGLEAVRLAAQASQAWTKGLAEQVQAVDTRAGEPPQFDPASGGKPGSAEVTTLRQAIELEKEAASIYFTAAQRSREPNIRAFYRYLAPSEGKHNRLLESYFDGYLKLATRR